LYKLPLASSAINETDSIVKVQDGHIVAIGGLMRVSSTQDRAGLPGVSEVPGLGALFRQKQTYTNKRELVVLIRPTVIDEQGNNWERDEPNAPMLAPLR
jgi:MSHA biogenesis protein MshL